jgi:hypothetical protein
VRASPLAQVDHRIGGLLDPEPLGQGGSQQQAGVGDGVGVVEAGVELVEGGQCPAEWWALRVILGVYSPLSIAAMPPVSLVGLRWAMDPSDRSWRSPDCHSSCMSAAG